jgi:hypothetical protein
MANDAYKKKTPGEIMFPQQSIAKKKFILFLFTKIVSLQQDVHSTGN